MIIKEDLRFSMEGDSLRAEPIGEIDHHNAKRLRERIDSQLFSKKPGGLILDFSSVRFMDSSGIGRVIGRAEICRELGITVRLTGLSSTAKRLITLSGVDKLQNLTVEI